MRPKSSNGLMVDRRRTLGSPNDIRLAESVTKDFYVGQFRIFLPEQELKNISFFESASTALARCNLCSHSENLPSFIRADLEHDKVMEGIRLYQGHLSSPRHQQQLSNDLLVPSPVPADPSPNIVMGRTVNLAGTRGRLSLPGRWINAAGSRISDNREGSDTEMPEEDHAGHAHPADSHPRQPSVEVRLDEQSIRNSPTAGRTGSVPGPCMDLPRSGGGVNGTVASSPVSQENVNKGPFGWSLGCSPGRPARAYVDPGQTRFGAVGDNHGGGLGDSLKNQAGEAYVARERAFLKHILNTATIDFEDVVSVADARKELGLYGSDDKIKGMSVQLLPHQVIGVDWMVKQERDETKKGGILADDMGLGKTVQMISTMVKGQPVTPRANPVKWAYSYAKRRSTKTVVRRTTLVLAPVALLQQWHDEIVEKTEPDTLKVHIHYGKDKLKTISEIQKYDVVVTSYRTLLSDIPPPGINGENMSGSGNRDVMNEEGQSWENDSRVGALGRMKWLRVVIDEAQNIRNRQTQISEAVTKLDAEYRWCLTGTPIINSLKDLYSLIRFCRYRPLDDWATFYDKICKDEKTWPKRAGQKAQTILNVLMLRRLKESTIDGKPILQLGPKNVEVVLSEFTPDERSIYDHIEKKQQVKVSKFIQAGTVVKNYKFIFAMILRLRQLCGHPDLILEKAEEDDNVIGEVAQRKRELDRAREVMGESLVSELLHRFRERVKNRMRDEYDQNDCGSEEDRCEICCGLPALNRSITHCGHEFCSGCVKDLLRTHMVLDEETGPLCPVCRNAIDATRLFDGSMFEPTQEELDMVHVEISRRRPARCKRKVVLNGRRDTRRDGLSEAEIEAMLKKSRLEPSTKMMRLVELIRHWRNEAPEDKVIIFSQWTSMLDLVERQLQQYDITCLRYDGKMKRMERVNAVSNLNKASGPCIILISLHCGGVGLNLTAANRVINLDLSWSFATESQAYNRVHRIGQQKPLEVKRLIVANTIEERILQMQDRKQALSDAALGEGGTGKIKGFTVRDIAQLFDLHLSG